MPDQSESPILFSSRPAHTNTRTYKSNPRNRTRASPPSSETSSSRSRSRTPLRLSPLAKDRRRKEPHVKLEEEETFDQPFRDDSPDPIDSLSSTSSRQSSQSIDRDSKPSTKPKSSRSTPHSPARSPYAASHHSLPGKSRRKTRRQLPNNGRQLLDEVTDSSNIDPDGDSSGPGNSVPSQDDKLKSLSGAPPAPPPSTRSLRPRTIIALPRAVDTPRAASTRVCLPEQSPQPPSSPLTSLSSLDTFEEERNQEAPRNTSPTPRTRYLLSESPPPEEHHVGSPASSTTATESSPDSPLTSLLSFPEDEDEDDIVVDWQEDDRRSRLNSLLEQPVLAGVPHLERSDAPSPEEEDSASTVIRTPSASPPPEQVIGATDHPQFLPTGGDSSAFEKTELEKIDPEPSGGDQIWNLSQPPAQDRGAPLDRRPFPPTSTPSVSNESDVSRPESSPAAQEDVDSSALAEQVVERHIQSIDGRTRQLPFDASRATSPAESPERIPGVNPATAGCPPVEPLDLEQPQDAPSATVASDPGASRLEESTAELERRGVALSEPDIGSPSPPTSASSTSASSSAPTQPSAASASTQPESHAHELVSSLVAQDTPEAEIPHFSPPPSPFLGIEHLPEAADLVVHEVEPAADPGTRLSAHRATGPARQVFSPTSGLVVGGLIPTLFDVTGDSHHPRFRSPPSPAPPSVALTISGHEFKSISPKSHSPVCEGDEEEDENEPPLPDEADVAFSRPFADPDVFLSAPAKATLGGRGSGHSTDSPVERSRAAPRSSARLTYLRAAQSRHTSPDQVDIEVDPVPEQYLDLSSASPSLRAEPHSPLAEQLLLPDFGPDQSFALSPTPLASPGRLYEPPPDSASSKARSGKRKANQELVRREKTALSSQVVPRPEPPRRRSTRTSGVEDGDLWQLEDPPKAKRKRIHPPKTLTRTAQSAAEDALETAQVEVAHIDEQPAPDSVVVFQPADSSIASAEQIIEQIPEEFAIDTGIRDAQQVATGASPFPPSAFPPDISLAFSRAYQDAQAVASTIDTRLPSTSTSSPLIQKYHCPSPRPGKLELRASSPVIDHRNREQGASKRLFSFPSLPDLNQEASSAIAPESEARLESFLLAEQRKREITATLQEAASRGSLRTRQSSLAEHAEGATPRPTPQEIDCAEPALAVSLAPDVDEADTSTTAPVARLFPSIGAASQRLSLPDHIGTSHVLVSTATLAAPAITSPTMPEPSPSTHTRSGSSMSSDLSAAPSASPLLPETVPEAPTPVTEPMPGLSTPVASGSGSGSRPMLTLKIKSTGSSVPQSPASSLAGEAAVGDAVGEGDASGSVTGSRRTAAAKRKADAPDAPRAASKKAKSAPGAVRPTIKLTVGNSSRAPSTDSAGVDAVALPDVVMEGDGAEQAAEGGAGDVPELEVGVAAGEEPIGQSGKRNKKGSGGKAIVKGRAAVATRRGSKIEAEAAATEALDDALGAPAAEEGAAKSAEQTPAVAGPSGAAAKRKAAGGKKGDRGSLAGAPLPAVKERSRSVDDDIGDLLDGTPKKSSRGAPSYSSPAPAGRGADAAPTATLTPTPRMASKSRRRVLSSEPPDGNEAGMAVDEPEAPATQPPVSVPPAPPTPIVPPHTDPTPPVSNVGTPLPPIAKKAGAVKGKGKAKGKETGRGKVKKGSEEEGEAEVDAVGQEPGPAKVAKAGKGKGGGKGAKVEGKEVAGEPDMRKMVLKDQGAKVLAKRESSDEGEAKLGKMGKVPKKSAGAGPGTGTGTGANTPVGSSRKASGPAGSGSGASGQSTPVPPAGVPGPGPGSAPAKRGAAGSEKKVIARSSSLGGLAAAAGAGAGDKTDTPVKSGRQSMLAMTLGRMAQSTAKKEKEEKNGPGASSANKTTNGASIDARMGRPKLVLTAEEQRQYNDSAPLRERERARRAEWRKTAINLQAAKDAYKLDQLNHNNRVYAITRRTPMGMFDEVLAIELCRHIQAQRRAYVEAMQAAAEEGV